MTDTTTTRTAAPEWDPSKPLGVASSEASSGGGQGDYLHPEPGAFIAEVITIREIPREQWPVKKKYGTDEIVLDKDGKPKYTPQVRIIWRMLRDEDGEVCADEMTLGQKVTLSMYRTANLNKIAAAIYRIDFIPDGYAITPAHLIGHQAWVDVKDWTQGDKSGVYIAGVRPLTGKRAAANPPPVLSQDDQEELPF